MLLYVTMASLYVSSPDRHPMNLAASMVLPVVLDTDPAGQGKQSASDERVVPAPRHTVTSNTSDSPQRTNLSPLVMGWIGGGSL
jgi:hypothetical protein